MERPSRATYHHRHERCASPTRTGAAPSLLVPALLACYLIWGSTYLAIRFALVSFPPLVIGTLMLGGGMGLTAAAEQHIGSGLIAAFIAVVPMMTCGIGLLFGQRPTRLELAGMALGMVGIVLLLRGASFAASPVGIACIAGASLSWSLGSVRSTTRLPIAPGPMGFASEMLCGGAVLMLISLAMREHVALPIEPSALAAWAYLVVFGSLIAFSAYLYLLGRASPAMATSYAFVNPLIALVLGAFFGGEQVTAGEWIACCVVLAGVVLIFRGKSRGAPQ